MIDDPVLVNDWHVVMPSADLPEGQPKSARLLGEDVVLWRINGQVIVWQDLCLHRGTRLSLGRVDGETLICPYHGWVYDETGQCIRIPAHPDQPPPTRAKAKPYQAQEKYEFVWVSLGQPVHDIPDFPEWDKAEYRKIRCGPYTFAASGPRAIENFLDVAHFPFVHEGFLGDPAYPEIDDYEVNVDENGVLAKDIQVWQPNPDGTGVGKKVSYTYRAMRPLTAHFTKSSAGPSFAIFYTVTPVEAGLSIGWMWETMNYGHDIPEAELRAFQDEVTAQDVPIVESQRPELLPLDLQAELHLRSDRTAIAYRKWLKSLGLTFGTA